MIASRIRYRWGLPLVIALLLALVGVGLVLAWSHQAASGDDDEEGGIVNAMIDMTCFPPPSPRVMSLKSAHHCYVCYPPTWTRSSSHPVHRAGRI
jgi:hypothetical protein